MPVVMSFDGSVLSVPDRLLRQTPQLIGGLFLLCHLSIHVGILLAEVYGPERPIPLPSSPGTSLDTDGRFTLSLPPADALFGDLPRRWALILEEEHEPDTIERVSGEEKGPRIPEPMVFDLVRPLGATRGEAEFNALGLVPLSRKTRRVDDVPDPLGLVRRSPDTQGIEWAPEIEFVLTDGIAFELELPMENARVEAYKAAGQVTFGTAFENRFIHGAQTILQYDLDPRIWTTTWLYLAGFRLDDTWSLFGMVGPRFELGRAAGGTNAEMLSNVTLFADVTDRLVAGVETNFGQVVGGHAALLVMPQVHYEVGKYWMIQVGVGARFTHELTLPEVGFRIIHEF